MLTKTNLYYNVNDLIPLLNNIKWDEKNRCQLNSPIGNWLYDPYIMKDLWKNTGFEELLNMLSNTYPIGEARLIKLQPGTCYRSHTDVDDRLHINIIGNDQSYLIDLDTQTLYKTISDNFVYYMDASHKHVAANFGSFDRIQLVVRVRLIKNTNINFKLKKIKFVKVYDKFRYDFDNEISPIISHKIKQKEIGFFDFVNGEILIECEQHTLNDIIDKLKLINKDYVIL